MSSESDLSRRDFVAGALAVAGGMVLLTSSQNALAAMSSAEPQLLLFDPDRPDACRSVAGGAGLGCAARPVVGDRVRFAREVLSAADAPEIVAGLTSYADFILLTGSAAENGYRVLSERAQGSLVHWKIARLRRATSS